MIWRSSYHSRIAQLADFLTSFIGFLLSFKIWEVLFQLYPNRFAKPLVLHIEHIFLFVIFSLIYVSLFYYNGAYSYQRFTSLIKEYVIISKVSILGSLISLAIVFLLGYGSILRIIFLLPFIIIISAFLIQKTLLFFIAAAVRKKGKDRKRVIVIGTGTRAKQFIERVANNFKWGLDIIGLLTGDEEKVGEIFYGYKAIDHYKNIEKVLKELNPEEVIITISTRRFDYIRDVLEICEREGVQVRLNSDFFGHINKDVRVDKVYGLNIISFSTIKQPEFQLYIKRMLDIVGDSVALLQLRKPPS